MKILYVQDTDWIRRNPIPHTFISERLVLKGHEVRAIDYEILWRREGKKELWSKRQVFSISRVLKNAPVTVIRPGILKVPILDYVSMLFTYGREINLQLSEFKPDVVIGNDILTTYLAYKAARKRGIPTIFYSLDIDYRLIPFRFLQPIGKLIESKNIRSATTVLAVNRGLRDYVIGMGASPDKTRVLNAGFEPQRFHPGVDGGEVRNKYGIKRDDIVLVFVGWIHHFNGLKEVALEMARTLDSRIKLLVVGDGDAYGDLQRIKEEHGLQDRFILIGRIPYEEVPEYIAASDICLLPSYTDEPIMREIVPMKLWEYMAMGKPIIATRLPGITKEFEDKSGLVYIDRPQDTVVTAAKLLQDGLIKELGEKSLKYVRNYNWDTITDEFEKILEGLTGKK